MGKLNNVDMSILEGVTESFKKDPKAAITDFKSVVKWKDGFYTEAVVGDYKPMPIDEPAWLSGTEKGPNPVEYLLSALGACLTVGFIATATGMGIKVNSLEVDVSGQIDLGVFMGLKEGNSGFDDVYVRFDVDADATDEQVAHLAATAMKLSPVRNTLQHNVEVHATHERK